LCQISWRFCWNIPIIADAIPKRQYYYVSERGRRLYELALGPIALALVGVSDKDSVLEVKKCEARFGERWVEEWLRRRGVRLDSLNGEQQPEKELAAA
jgi:type IV secretion system protein VirB4